MDNKGRINHIFKIMGVILILLALTVFARAETHTFDCDDTFNCSLKSYCENVPGAVLGLRLHQGTAWSDYGQEPTEYTFNSNYTGEQTCEATVTVTGFYDQAQANEKTQIFINGTDMGTTIDNHCNADGGGCVFCGRETQSLGARTVTLQQTNTLKIHGYDSHAVVAVVVDCTGGTNCSQNLDPVIDTMPDKTIPYNTGFFRIDLWDKITDHTDQYSDLNIDVSVAGNTVNCTLDNNRYLECQAGFTLGVSTITIDVNDPCEGMDTESFDVNVINQPPHITVPDQTQSCSADMNQFIDLRYYGWDEQIDDVNLAIVAQTNTDLISCYVENDYYLTCDVNNCAEDYSDLTVTITDIFGEDYTDIFRINLANQPPTWTNEVEDKCFNSPKYKYIDLRNYTTDIEDGNNLSFSLTQTNTNALDCYIEDNYYLSCDSISNQKATSTLTITATDSKGLTATTTADMSTNCSGHYDFNSNIKAVCLEECTSYTSEIYLTNNANETKCFNLELESDYTPFDVSLNRESFCLNKNESTTLYMSANTCGADHDEYEVRVYDEDNNLELFFDYEIGSCNNFDGFRINEYDGKICQGEKRTYSVDITNTANQTKKVYLMAENVQILPFFSKDSVTLTSGQTKTVDLTINAKYAPLGHHSILLGGDAPNYHIEKHLDLEVMDCSDIRERNFLITAPDICYDVERGQTFEGSFNVERLKDNCCCECEWDTKSILLSIIGMPNELAYNSLDLRCSEEKKVEYTLYVPATARAGTHFVTIVGEEQPDAPFDTDVGFVDPKEICLNVLGESNSNILLRTQSKDIPWCDTEIFELELINTGDFDETFDLTALDIPVGVTVFFSEDTITVPKGESKIVYVSIATDPDSIIGSNQFITVNLDGNISLSTKIYFNITQKIGSADLEFLSSIDVLAMKINQEGEFEVMFRNNTEKTLYNIELSIENLPNDVNYSVAIIPEIASGNTARLKGKIVSGDTNGEFFPVFVLSAGSIKNKEKFTLVIEKSEQNADLAAFSGLSGLSGLFSFGELSVAIGLSVFLILLLLVIILVLAALSKSHRNEEWLGVEKI
jgi:uncharacterized membrane protein